MMRAPATHQDENRPLTSIRGLAATWVFVAHVSVAFWKYLPPGFGNNIICGWLGVDIFFVLSGFILAKVYAGLTPDAIGAFWLRRVFRLFPLNVLVIAVMALCALAGFKLGTVDWPHILWHFLMLQSFVPGHKGAWVFVNWSVGVELVCYIAFPAVIMAIARIGMPWLLPVSIMVSAGCWWGETQVLGQFFGWPALQRGACGFVLGVFTGALSLRSPQPRVWCASLLEAAGLSGIIYGTLGGAGAAWCVAPGSWQMGLVPVGSAVLIAGLGADSGVFARLLRAAPLFWIGRVSYSIYLLHMLVINGTRPALLWLSGGHPRLRDIAAWGVCAYLLTNLLAAMTFLSVEQPARRLGNVFIRRFVESRPKIVSAQLSEAGRQ